MKKFFLGFVCGVVFIIVLVWQAWQLVVSVFESLLLVASVSGCVLIVAYSVGRVRVWAIRSGGYVTQFVGHGYDRGGVGLAGGVSGVISDVGDTNSDSESWRSAVVRFGLVGHRCGFGSTVMLRYMDRAAWDCYTELLVKAGVLLLGRGRRSTEWAPRWDLGRLRFELRTGGLLLPYPVGSPPDVSW